MGWDMAEAKAAAVKEKTRAESASDKVAAGITAIEEATGDGAASEGEPKPSGRMPGKKLVLFIVLPVVVALLGAGGAAWHFHLLDFLTGKKPGSTRSGPKLTLFFDLPEMLVNLNTKGKNASYLKLKVALEVDDPMTIARLEQLMPRVVDNFQVYLRELRGDDLTGSAGLYRLKEELLMRVNLAVQPAKVNDVLFREMLVQ
jgi:flagellar protein FliL